MTPERRGLERLFRPASVVLVGASDRSPWSALIHANYRKMGWAGPLHLVNKRGAQAHGQAAFASCAAIRETPDLAYIFVPTDAVADALADVVAAGIPYAMILSSGFAETGDAGAARQSALCDVARAAGTTLIGPNALGFVNYVDGIAVTAFAVDAAMPRGGVGIVSQSGATANVLASFAEQQGIGLSYVIASGNEADLDTASIVEFLVEDDATCAVAVFAETIKSPSRFRAVAARAADVGKPLVMLKVGRTQLASQMAQSHTGSVTGDDRVFDAVCRQDNVVRVDTLEQLIVTAGLLAGTGRIEGEVAFISISGGACELIADRAEVAGLPLRPFGSATADALRTALPDYGSVFNPLDVTGAAVGDPALFGRVLGILAADPAIGITGCVYELPRSASDYTSPPALSAIGAGLRAARQPGLLINQTTRPVTAHSREIMHTHAIPGVIGGLDHAICALAAARRWSARKPRSVAHALVAPANARPRSEREALAYLGGRGVPVPPLTLATIAAQAVAAGRALGGPIVLKISSPQILHKSDVGGVRLSLEGDAEIAAAFDAIIASGRAAMPGAAIEGCLVLPMRRGGIELFVGVTRSDWGPVLALGLGGVWIEALDDVALRLLPVAADDVTEMIGELRGRRVLDGYRGAPAVNIAALAEVVRGIGEAAMALGPGLVSLEVNPLFASGARIECLDALALWDDA